MIIIDRGHCPAMNHHRNISFGPVGRSGHVSQFRTSQVRAFDVKDDKQNHSEPITLCILHIYIYIYICVYMYIFHLFGKCYIMLNETASIISAVIFLLI